MASDLKSQLSEKTHIFHLKVWVLLGIFVGISFVSILLVLSICLASRKKARRANDRLPVTQIPTVSMEIREIKIDQNSANHFFPPDGDFLTLHDKFSDKDSDKLLIHSSVEKMKEADNSSQSGSFNHLEKDGDGSQSGEKGSFGSVEVSRTSLHCTTAPSPLSGLPEFSHLGWGHWFTLRDLEIATNRFSKEKCHWGQAEKEFRVEVEAIGHVRHKNLVRLLGYCIEGTHRLLVYEYVNNGNLEQWLHGAMRQHGYLTWEARMKILLGTAKAFGVVLLEAITGRDPVDYGRPAHEVNLVDWLKMMVGSRRSEEVVDPTIEVRPATSALKRALLTALRCVDPDGNKRPKMSQVVRMLESEEYPVPREDRRHRRNDAGTTEGESQRENSVTEKSDIPVLRSQSRRNPRA
ncbi:protein kinase superfamily protein [Actinidia rufa]|uniref:non-specific serine/threonine protein kinase n=1 Tax=Actinidia rufa TaxID=165716 RepID=A0A7J0GSN6_9ERIC|nr:protein kinase superfamily protein [Actinidia rufa]